jgi:hypothetical protein
VFISNFGVMFFDDPMMAFASIAAVVRPGRRLAFWCLRDDTENEVFAMPLRVFSAYSRLPDAAQMTCSPITDLLSGTGWSEITITPVTERARIGTDVDDLMAYIRGMPRIRDLTASLNDPTAAERVLAAIAEEYAARQTADGVWVRAAAWLVTARRA